MLAWTVAEEGFKKRIEYLKKEGNQAHRAKDSKKSQWFYQRAIDIIERSPYKMPRDLAILYNNMATVHAAISDNEAAFRLATKSVQLDPTYHKVITVRLYLSFHEVMTDYLSYHEGMTVRLHLSYHKVMMGLTFPTTRK